MENMIKVEAVGVQVRRPQDEVGPRHMIEDASAPGGYRDSQVLYPGDPPIDVPDTRYWRKRLEVGDVRKVEATVAAKTAPLVAKKKEE